MRSIITKSLAVAIGLAFAASTGGCGGCVYGNLIDFHSVLKGGTLAIEGCPYSVTTVMGAEAPSYSTAIFGVDATPRLVHLGVVGDPKTSVVMQWRTTDEVTRAGVVRWAQGANLSPDQLTTTVNGIQFAYTGTACMVGGPACPFRQHQAHVCNLQPGAAYSYQVGAINPNTGAQDFSPVYTFQTAPDITAAPDTDTLLGFVGDARGGYDIWQQLVNQLLSYKPEMLLFSGDAVTIGTVQAEYEEFLGEAEPLLATTQMYFANGNHEGDAVNFFSQFAMPGDQQNFGVDWGYAHITVANDTPADPNAITGAFQQDLATDLAASANARWKLVMHHQPIWSASTKHGSTLTLQQAWQPLYDQYHVDLVLNGHDHDYEVTKPLVGMTPQPTADNATVYIVAGGAGAELYPNGSGFWTQYSESTYSAATIDIRQNSLAFSAFRNDGTPIPTGFMKTKP
jgi:hypothetical protein